ncbi:ATP-dependent helicase [Peptoniphilus catoniae]|uniref:ATP-dependent helicase n=1 Tax=Peptoniphilus catoniae TaxID=1660341 RepID=UPI0010FF3C4C|nr:ATP-dependent helicase [Peptoniphilus catoniae]
MNLSKQQLKAIDHDQGPALILAVPGAGKTSILLYRTLKLIKSGTDPKRILTITFSKAASLDINRRFQHIYKDNFNKPVFSTIHALCYGIVLDYARLRGKKYTLIESGSSSKFKIISDIYYSLNRKYLSEENIEEILNKISYFKNSMKNPQDEKTNIPNFMQIYLNYEYYKKSKGLIDFDDMILLSLEILKKENYILNKKRSAYDYLQLDEGQDTSIAQFEVIKLLASPKNNLLIVADDDQSIYGFRGASPDYLLKLKEIYKNLKFYYLENNFRSSKNIVNTSKLFIKKNTNRFNKKISTLNDYIDPVNIVKVERIRDQYRFIYENIKKYPDKSHGILYRNNLSSLGLMEYLERRNVEFNLKGSGVKILNHFIVKDILDIIKFSNNTTDIDTFSRIYYKVKGYISKAHLKYLKNNLRGDLFISLVNYPNLPNYYKENILKLRKDFKILKALNISDQINYVINELGYDFYLRDMSEKFGYNYESLKEFYIHLSYIAKSERTLDDFIGRLKYLDYLIKTKSFQDSNISLSTIHSAKGLEYDCVYVLDMVEGILPSISDNVETLEEDRRLFYVAMTRAKNHLYLLYPKTFNSKSVAMSSFLEEISQVK